MSTQVGQKVTKRWLLVAASCSPASGNSVTRSPWTKTQLCEISTDIFTTLNAVSYCTLKNINKGISSKINETIEFDFTNIARDC